MISAIKLLLTIIMKTAISSPAFIICRFFLMRAILTCVTQYLIVLICISLI